MSAPTHISIREVTSTTVKVTWDPLPKATGYTISYNIIGSGSIGQTNQVDDGTTHCTLNNLEKNTSYNITVERGTGDDGDGKRNNERAVKEVTTGK